jgi:hypothetical protein
VRIEWLSISEIQFYGFFVPYQLVLTVGQQNFAIKKSAHDCFGLRKERAILNLKWENILETETKIFMQISKS